MLDTLKDALHSTSLDRMAHAALLIVLILLAAKLIQRALVRRLEPGHAAHRIRKSIGVVAYVAAALVLVAAYSDRLTGLTVALGVAGAGIAFALQEVIASIAGWVALAFGRFYSTGDRVQLGGIRGDVIDIGILRTTLMEVGQWVDGDLYNGRIVRVANSFVFKEPVFNYSADFPFLWDEIKVPIRYGCDWQMASGMLEAVLNGVCGDFARQSESAWAAARARYALENARVTPMVSLVANDNWIELTGRYVVDYRQRRLTKDAIFRRILTEIDQSAGQIRLASTTVEIMHLPPLQMQTSSGDSPPPHSHNSARKP
jgi:small-conductance mechanosensitive channel